LEIGFAGSKSSGATGVSICARRLNLVFETMSVSSGCRILPTALPNRPRSGWPRTRTPFHLNSTFSGNGDSPATLFLPIRWTSQHPQQVLGRAWPRSGKYAPPVSGFVAKDTVLCFQRPVLVEHFHPHSSVRPRRVNAAVGLLSRASDPPVRS
jgi:hypothetical protein